LSDKPEERDKMRLNDLVNCRSLQGAKLVVEISTPDLPVTGINILEATDIERWGKAGMVLLSSYFALQKHDHDELKIFFEKIKQIGIAAIIIKVNRLVNEIPQQFVELCREYEIALFQIDDQIKYEDIIVEVLGSILAMREQRLSLYYKISKLSSEMTLELLSTQEILERFKTLMGFDLTLIEKDKRYPISTNPVLAKFTLVKAFPIFVSEYMTFDYRRFSCQYEKFLKLENQFALLVDFSTSEETEATLVIHEKPERMIDEDDVMVVENLVRCLQLNLLRESLGKQKKMMKTNSLVNDLLRGLVNEPTEFDSVCADLEINIDADCQVLTFDYYSPRENDLIALFEIKDRIRAEIKRNYHNVIYYITPRYDQYVFIFDNQSSHAVDKNIIKKILDDLLPKDSQSPVKYFCGISDPFQVRRISLAAAQSKSVADFLSQNHIGDTLSEYRDLGFFKLFLSKENLQMLDFVPEDIIRMQRESKELFDTLCVYLKNNQSYKLTAEAMFLHPKTVKYRIEKMVREYQINFDDVHSLTILLASIEILEFKHQM
jgi:purine catabolism regulator